jgi:hypothetical protein
VAARGVPWEDATKPEYKAFKKLVYYKVAYQTPRTFGAALRRAETQLLLVS